MNSETGGILGVFGFLASMGGLIYAAINHKKVRCRCCGKDLDMSVDIDPTDKKKKKKPVKEGEPVVQDEEAPEEEAPEPSPEASEAEPEPEPVKKKRQTKCINQDGWLLVNIPRQNPDSSPFHHQESLVETS